MARNDFELGGGYDVDLVFLHGGRIVIRQRSPKSFLSGIARADASFKNLPWCLALTEAGKLHIFGQRTEGDVEIFIELRLFNFNV